MRQRRTLNDRHAPVLTDEKYGTEQRKSYTVRPVNNKPFKFKSKWINYQLLGLFKGWD